MCKLSHHSEKKSVFGYKVVAIKTFGEMKFYSPATGVQYINNKPIDTPTYPASITDYFHKCFLAEDDPSFSRNMIGRTAVFLDEYHAETLAKGVLAYISPNWRILVEPAIVYEDVMFGSYAFNKVAAGRKIYFPSLDKEFK